MIREQFTIEVERIQGAVRRFLTALCCGNTALADDLAQDTFVKAYVGLDRFKADERFGAWIYRIAYNTFISHCRSSRPHGDLTEGERECSTEGADKVFEYESLYAALGKIAAKERAAILLFYMQGYAIAEIVEITGDSQAAVKQQLSRGRQHLREILNKE